MVARRELTESFQRKQLLKYATQDADRVGHLYQPIFLIEPVEGSPKLSDVHASI
jgi:hypothetical protein